MSSSKLSFTIRRPTPVSRASSAGADSDSSSFKVPALPRHLSSNNNSTPGSPLGRNSPKLNSRTYEERDSSDEEGEMEDELVTGFDEFGVQRLHEKKKAPTGPLVIPALANRDWREVARKRKSAHMFVPPSASATTGADGSVGGLGTRDSINSGPQFAGLQMKKKVKLQEEEDTTRVKMEVEEETTVVSSGFEETREIKKDEEQSEDAKALRAVLASASGFNGEEDYSNIQSILVSEEEALQQDIQELPEPATLDDYERVPVSQFGAALLRGMGWKPPSEMKSASGKEKVKKGLMVEPWLPQARPALLGIGAKEKEVFDDGSKGKKKRGPDKKYVPLIKVERREGENGSERGSGSSSRRRTPERDIDSRGSSRRRSPDSRGGSRRRTPEHDRDSGRDRDRERDSDRDRRRDDRERRGRDRDHDHSSSSSSRRDRERGHDSSSRCDRDSDRRKDERDSR